MVDINSFDFNSTYQNIVVDISIPDYEVSALGSTVYIKKITIGTQNAYDVEADIPDFKFDDEGQIASYNEYFNITTHNYGWELTLKEGVTDRITSFATTSPGIPLDMNNMSLNDLYFIKIETGGSYSVNTPCNNTGDTWGSLYDKFGIDAKGMQYMKELADGCNTPTDLIDYILNKNAIDVAAGCGDYATMISRYNELMGYSNVTTIGNVTNNYKKCGCNG